MLDTAFMFTHAHRDKVSFEASLQLCISFPGGPRCTFSFQMSSQLREALWIRQCIRYTLCRLRVNVWERAWDL